MSQSPFRHGRRFRVPWRFALSFLVVPLLAATAGCRSYRPEPLLPRQLLEGVRYERARPPTGPFLTLEEAVVRMRCGNPRIREARAAWARACTVARTPTPLPNPSLSLGPLFLAGADILGSSHWGIEGGLGWTVLLTGTRRLRDDVKAARAAEAFTEAACVEREEYLELRAAFVSSSLRREQQAATEEVLQAALASVGVVRSLVKAGEATALDVRLLQLDAERLRADLIAAEEATAEADARLAARMGVDAEGLPAPSPYSLPGLPTRLPSASQLEEVVLHHPAMDRLRARYEVAERDLRLEIARQVPTLDLGASYEREEGTDRFGLPFGIEIPLFDRNQPAIADAAGARREVREKYVAALTRALGEVGEARPRVRARMRRHALLEGELRTASDEALEVARAAVVAGGAGALQVLEVERQHRAVRLERASARVGLFEAWADLERALGSPLLAFRVSQPAGATPVAPSIDATGPASAGKE
jgi:outer membrane protein TolC